MRICASATALPLADESVQCVVTSPPYWGLRKYAGEQELVWGGDDTLCVHEWRDASVYNSQRSPINFHEDGSEARATFGADNTKNSRELRTIHADVCSRCGAWRGAYGLEPTVEAYVEHTVEVLRELRRVLRKDGVVFWNVGDSYGGGNAGNQANVGQRSGKGKKNDELLFRKDQVPGLKPKDLCLVPFRVALAAQADGWWVRSAIVWTKPNPMPESVTDRPTDAYELVLMLTKSARYFYDAAAVAERARGDTRKPYARGQVDSRGDGHTRGGGVKTDRDGSRRNLRNVWTFPTQPYSGAHFATFPEELPRRCILAATSAKGACRFCGAPWESVARRKVLPPPDRINNNPFKHDERDSHGEGATTLRNDVRDLTLGWRPTCRCRGQRGETRPCVVLDPFGGSGTTARVAIALGRSPILVDLAYRAEYAELARKRTREVQIEMF